ncbi:MAG: hypothetical protein GC160_17540 [Acidobacteria bacterium]|nr:hypothetical protein [Acidobacteriota bacterium]
MPLALGLDLGTTSLAAVAVDERGTIRALATRPNDSAVAGLPSGRAEQEPSRLRAVALELLAELANSLDAEPACLGLTGQMHGVLLAGPDRRPLTRLISWQDRRANEPAANELNGQGTWLEALAARCDGAALAESGCRLAPGYGAVTLFCLREGGELPAGDGKALTIADWLAADLCDGERATDRTLAASLGAFDLARQRWSEPILSAAGLSSALFPAVRPSGAPLGGLSPTVAAACGLPAGLPVCGAVGDQQAAFLGSVPPGAGVLQINLGTGGQISWELDGFRPVPGMEVRPLPPDVFLAVGAGVSGGDAYAWLQRTVSGWLRSFGVERESDEIYGALNRLAAAAPSGADGLRCEPSFRGTRQRPQARGRFEGVSNDNFHLGTVARSVLEGIVEGLHDFYEGAGEEKPARIERIIGSGNAFERNPLLSRIIEQRFGCSLWTPEQPEAAARGAALLAGSATGVWPDLATARATTALRRLDSVSRPGSAAGLGS